VTQWDNVETSLTRRRFLRMTAAASAAVASVPAFAAGTGDALLGRRGNDQPDMRLGSHPLVVKPVLTYELPSRQESSSWRSWGELHSPELVAQEQQRIDRDLASLVTQADFPLRTLPTAAVRSPEETARIEGLDRADAILIYAAGGPAQLFEVLLGTGKPVVFFIRHKTKPYYLWHEIIHPRFLRAHSDQLARQDADYDDVVVDDPAELRWRLRALFGLRNTVGRRILAVGGPGGWAVANAPDLARQRWSLDIRTVEYPDLEQRLRAAHADQRRVAQAEREGEELARQKGVTLETSREFVAKGFLLTEVFRELLAEAEAHAITVSGCMTTIMPMAQTAPCLTLSLLNDAGYMAYCESDFVVIPAGILLHHLAGKPTFFCNPTYPHDDTITFAHCTAPRRMNGVDLEPARIVTHFESDYGAAPKVQFRRGQTVTALMPDFRAEEWVGYRCEIVDHPFLPICRSQIEARVIGDDHELTREMRGFHHMVAYGDYLREVGYALKKVGIRLLDLSAS